MASVECGPVPASTTAAETGQGVGARLNRKEDDRFMRGRGQYVADIRLPGLQDIAFVRSPLAHARIRAVHVPERLRDVVFTGADITGVTPIRAVSGLPGFKISEQPVLATGKVRHVGELGAMCVEPRPRISRQRSRWTSNRCRRSMTCARPATWTPRSSTNIGATTSSSKAC